MQTREINLLSRIVLATVVALLFLVIYNRQRIDSDNLALGSESISAYESWNDRRITASRPNDIAGLVEAHAGSLPTQDVAKSKSSYITWLGNSQLHTINQFRSGDHLAPYWLAQGVPKCPECPMPIGISLPNANVQEHLALTYFVTGRLPVSQIILNLVYDDLREDGLRAEFAPLLTEPVRQRLAATPVGREILEAQRTDHQASVTGEETGALHGFAQEYFEDRLVKALGAAVPLWADRANLRNLVMADLYELRNWVFRIKPSTTRPMIKPRYARNMAAFEALAENLRASGIPLLVYIAPIRQDVKLPYEIAAYQRWIAVIEQLSWVHGYRFLNLERLVPDNLWGSIRNDDVDFMHFQGPGHKILADRLLLEIEQTAAGKPHVQIKALTRP